MRPTSMAAPVNLATEPTVGFNRRMRGYQVCVRHVFHAVTTMLVASEIIQPNRLEEYEGT
jgi:hypothetical protein